MSNEELLYKIWEKVNDVDKAVAVIKSNQDDHIKKQDELGKSHYKLKGDFNLYKGRYLTLSGLVGSAFGITSTALWNYFFKK